MSKSTNINSFSKQFLKNHLRVLSYPVKEANSVNLLISLSGGSREEELSVLGITHLLEHLLFKKTRNLSGFDIAAKMDSLGGEVNATTDTDEIVLYGETISSELEGIFQLFSELLLDADFSEEDLVNEKSIIEQEITDSLDDPEQLAFNSLSEIFYQNSSFGKPVFGSKESLKDLSLSQVKDRLNKLLVGKRIVIAISGNFSPDKFLKLVESNFSSLEEGASPLHSAPEVSSKISFIKRPVEQVYFAMAINSASPEMPEYPKALILSHILGGGMASRLFQEIREKLAAAYDVGAELETAYKASMLLVSASFEKAKIEELTKVISNQLSELSHARLEKEEFTRSKLALSRAFLIDEGLPDSLMWRMLSTERSQGEYVSLKSFSEKIEKINFDEFKEYMLSAINKEERSAVLLGDLEEESLGYLDFSL